MFINKTRPLAQTERELGGQIQSDTQTLVQRYKDSLIPRLPLPQSQPGLKRLVSDVEAPSDVRIPQSSGLFDTKRLDEVDRMKAGLKPVPLPLAVESQFSTKDQIQFHDTGSLRTEYDTERKIVMVTTLPDDMRRGAPSGAWGLRTSAQDEMQGELNPCVTIFSSDGPVITAKSLTDRHNNVRDLRTVHTLNREWAKYRDAKYSDTKAVDEIWVKGSGIFAKVLQFAASNLPCPTLQMQGYVANVTHFEDRHNISIKRAASRASSSDEGMVKQKLRRVVVHHLRGSATVANFWVNCEPKPREGYYLWWLLVRRTKGYESLEMEYQRMRTEHREVYTGNKAKQTLHEEVTSHNIADFVVDRMTEFMTTIDDKRKEYIKRQYWRFEPYTSSDSSHPHPDLYNCSDVWYGACHRVGVVNYSPQKRPLLHSRQHFSTLSAVTNVDVVLYPQDDNAHIMLTGLQQIPEVGISILPL